MLTQPVAIRADNIEGTSGCVGKGEARAQSRCGEWRLSRISVHHGFDGRAGRGRLVSTARAFLPFPRVLASCHVVHQPITDTIRSVLQPEGVNCIPVVVDLVSLGLLKGE